MRRISNEELVEILRHHEMWLRGEEGGVKADLRNADLRNADLRGANLRYSDLRNADLQACLEGADLRNADLRGADLRNADLRYSDLRYSDLQGADLRHSDLQGADMRGVNLDYSAWPLWCGSLKIGKTDDKLICQLLYRTLQAAQASDGPLAKKLLASAEVRNIANQFHRVAECGEIGAAKENEK